MSIQQVQQRLADLSAEKARLENLRSAALQEHARGSPGAREAIALHTSAIRMVVGDLGVEREVLALAARDAVAAEHVARRAAARQAAADAETLMHEHEELAQKVDLAVDALAHAMNAFNAKANQASAAMSRALKLAIPDHQQRMQSYGFLYNVLDPSAGPCVTAAATALRQIFSGTGSPERIYTTPAGITFGPERVPFVEAAQWATDRAARSTVDVHVSTIRGGGASVRAICATREGA